MDSVDSCAHPCWASVDTALTPERGLILHWLAKLVMKKISMDHKYSKSWRFLLATDRDKCVVF